MRERVERLLATTPLRGLRRHLPPLRARPAAPLRRSRRAAARLRDPRQRRPDAPGQAGAGGREPVARRSFPPRTRAGGDLRRQEPPARRRRLRARGAGFLRAARGARLSPLPGACWLQASGGRLRRHDESARCGCSSHRAQGASPTALARSAPATCWSTSSRTPTTRSSSLVRELAGAQRQSHRGGRRGPGHLPLARRRRSTTSSSSRSHFPGAAVRKLERNYRSTADHPRRRGRGGREQRARGAARGCGPTPAAASWCALYRAGDELRRGGVGGARRCRRCSAAGRARLGATSRDPGAHQRADARLRRRAAAPPRSPTRWSAACASTSAPRSRTSSPTCACCAIRATAFSLVAHPQPAAARHRQRHRWRCCAEQAAELGATLVGRARSRPGARRASRPAAPRRCAASAT